MNKTETFQQFLTTQGSEIAVWAFGFNLILAGVLAYLLSILYVRYGRTLSNRKVFSNNFVIMAMTTMFIITIVKSSLALSLGLVGALSIVRFRAAIKDPEELVYLFMTIGIGLACGANQPLLALIAIVIILGVIWLSKRLTGEQHQRHNGRLFINITTDIEDLDQITALLVKHLPYVELKRMDTLKKGLDLSFVARADAPEQLNQLQLSIRKLSDNTSLSLLEQPELIV